MHDVVVKNGLVVSASGSYKADVGIDGEQIAGIGLDLDGHQVIDASGMLVIPGAVDPHVHLQMPLDGRVSTDSFASGTIAAVCGGTTTVIDFVTPHPGQSMLEALRDRQREAERSVAADFGLHMTIPTWHADDEYRLAEVKEAAEAGCPTFKLYQAYEGMALDDVALLRAMRAVAGSGCGVVLHSEVGPLIESLRRRALWHGHKQPIWHARTRPARLEASAVQRAIALAAIAGVRLYIFHVGAEEVVGAIRRARRDGQAVTAETCPHYMLLTAETHLTGPEGELFICAPPLRSEADQASLWQALDDGTISVVSTDHCPWTRAEKAQADFMSVPGGVPSIEARLSLVYHYGVSTGLIGLERWVESCCTQAARWMGLSHKGRIAPGFDADLVIFDPSVVRRISAETLHETADWTPYEGMEVTGWPRTVLLRGKPVVVDGEFQGKMSGRFVVRSLP